MRIAYLDCFSGISGDMFLGALLDGGLPEDLLRRTTEALHLDADLAISRVTRGGINAIKVDVSIAGDTDHYEPALSHAVGFAREEKSAAGATDMEHNRRETGTCHGISLLDIQTEIAALPLNDSVKRIAGNMFQSLAEAEARLHRQALEDFRFSEVGVPDVLVDLVCSAAGADALGVDRWICSPLNVGGGNVESTRGRFPIPAAVTLELLKGAPVYSSGLDAELVTPTGAALVRTLCGTRFGPFPAMTVETVAYGAGSRDFPGLPNVLRLTIGEAAPAQE